VVARALKRRCPYCGGGNIFTNWWNLRETCPSCGVSFSREEGYFLGAYAMNLIFAEFLALGIALYLLFATDLRDLPLGVQMVIAGGLAALFPIVLFPYARTLWMALDLVANPPGDNPERHLRRRDFHQDLTAKK
jgi:uncharacterized protein (DUF983 family)